MDKAKARWFIVFIYSNDCPDCKRMREIIMSLIETSEDIEFFEYESSTDMAIKVAVTFGIDDLPGCWVDPRNVICGKNFDEDRLRKAIIDLIQRIKDGSVYKAPHDDTWPNHAK